MLLNPLTIHTPASLKEALDLYSTLHSVKIQAGGTFLLNSLKLLKRKGAKTPEHIISLRKVKELTGVIQENGHLRIGAMTTITELSESPLLRQEYSVLKTVTKNISTTPIRNMATVGGNLTCRYTWTEMPAVMIGLNAKLHFAGPDGKKEVLDAEDFYMNSAKTDKMLTHVTVPQNPGAAVVYRRIKKTPNVDIPLLSMLITSHIANNRFTKTRVSINNCVDFAQRDRGLEDFLNQSECSKETADESLDHLDQSIYDKRANDYKKEMFRVCIQEAISELAARKG